MWLVLESSPPTGSGNKLSSHHLHSDLNTWTDTARSSPNLCSFLAPVPLSAPEDDDGRSLHNRQDPTSANTSRTDISTYSNERQSPRLQQGWSPMFPTCCLVSGHFILCILNRCHFNRSQFQSIAFSIFRNFEINLII